LLDCVCPFASGRWASPCLGIASIGHKVEIDG
jgi:hypothetical protein